MMEDYRHPELIHSTNALMELDIYIKPLKLAVEYQGEQHFRPVPHLTRDFLQQQIRDTEKKQACKEVSTHNWEYVIPVIVIKLKIF